MDYTPMKMYLDVVYVVDATNGGAIIENARKQITRFGRELPAFSNNYVCAVYSMREKLVFFGDFATEGENAIIETEFYESTRRAEFLANLDREDIKMSGGGSENGFEALFTAMRSDWRQVDFDKRERVRHIIVLITDAYPLRLREREGAFGYNPDDYPDNCTCLQNVWDSSGEQDSGLSLSKWDKRLVLVAPYGRDDKGHSWDDVMCLDKVFSIDTAADNNCEGVELCSNASFVEIYRGDDVWIHDLPPEPEPEPEPKKRVVPKINEIAVSDEGQASEKEFDVDVVLVLDTSGRMGMTIDFLQYVVPGIDWICETALKKSRKKIDKFRIKHIGFADYAHECDEAVQQTDFLEKFKPYDGSDLMQVPTPWWEYVRKDDEPAPENGFEALYAAMTSDWTELKDGRGGRQIIILMTDKYPLHLMERAGEMAYPMDELPKNVDELRLVWEGKAGDTKLSKSNKRLLLFAPGGEDEQGHSWKPVTEWENTTYFEVELDNYASDVDIVDALKEYIN